MEQSARPEPSHSQINSSTSGTPMVALICNPARWTIAAPSILLVDVDTKPTSQQLGVRRCDRAKGHQRRPPGGLHQSGPSGVRLVQYAPGEQHAPKYLRWRASRKEQHSTPSRRNCEWTGCLACRNGTWSRRNKGGPR